MNIQALKEIGMTDHEAKIYLVLLKHNQLSAYAVAEKTNLYRQVTYDALKRLLEKGFVSTVKQGKTQLYQAAKPELILEYLNEKTESFKQLIPDLTQLQQNTDQPLSVEVYKGENVTRIALRDIINTLKDKGGEVWCTAVNESIPFAKHATVCDQYERDMLAHNITEKVILQEGKKGLFQQGTSTYRKLPKKFFNDNPMQIYGDNVQILIWGNPEHLIIIRSKDVADAYRKQFQLLWQTAKT